MDSTRPGFIQSRVRCAGPAPTMQFHGRCDDATIRRALQCERPDFSKGLSDLLPYAKPMMGPLVFDCHKAQDVLVLGLGGHSTREVLAVDNNENVLKVARNYFGFQGEAMIDDIHSALSKLSRLDKSFDAIVTDVGHNIRLNQEDLHNVVHLLKPNGVLMENLSTPSFAEEQVALFKDFLGDVSEEVSFLIE
ncbi:Uncharacterized protein SCF082_LOCUS20984 [Durusdinium trenchii]|uniref:Uncharacterized protein n=1 Tax=Durusdinium trenchii TaxID=1381693 RepID=A0ABP0L6G8_9DINO